VENLIQSLNDKYLDLDLLLKDFDNLFGNLKTFYVMNEGENGLEKGEMFTLDEDGIDELRKIYYRLEKIID
jgi:hypothetical protein